MRKYLREIEGTKLFLLSTTATSTVTRLVSAENVAPTGPPSSFFGASLEGILGRSVVEAGADGGGVVAGAVESGEDGAAVEESAADLRGLATVSLPTDMGPSWARRQTNKPSRIENATISLFIKTSCF